MDSITIAGLLVLGGFPWVAKLSSININFVSNHIEDLPKIYSFLGSFFSILIVIICTNLPPTKIYFLANPMLPIYIGFVVLLIHFWIYNLFKGYVIQNTNTVKGSLLVTLHFITYVSIYTFFSLGVSAVKHNTTSELIEGQVVEKETKKPLKNAVITLLNDSDIEIYSAKTDDDGKFKIVIEKVKIPEIKTATISDNFHQNSNIIFNNQNEVLWKLENVEIAGLNELMNEYN